MSAIKLASNVAPVSRLAAIVRLAIGAVVTFVCVLTSLPLARADNVDGAWTDVHDWPLIAVHAALTPDGRVLSYGTTGSGAQTGYFIYDIWDPTAGLTSGHMTLENMTLTDIFCSSQIILPQSGEILISGGDNWTGSGTTNTGNNNSNLFDFGDNTLARSANMNRSRWYSSSTALVNGDIYIQGGNGGADRPEVRQTDGAFRLLGGAPTNAYATLFPRNFLAPDGRVFGYDTNGKMYFVSADGAGSLATAGQFSSANAGWTSGAAMFRPGKILQIGGNSNGALVIDINGPQPTLTPTQSMSSRRQWVSATVLADGQVLATGGSNVDNTLNGVNNFAEIWNPATGQWHVGSEAVPARLYHSSALLLPDATVLVAGGGAPGPLVNTNAEIYQPPYLFDGEGELAPRPTIQSAPDEANVGDSLPVEVDSSISRITLVKTGSVTHSVNMDQRFLELPFSTSGNMLDVTLPTRASDTPPGFYLLFAIDDSGVPSVGKMLRIKVDPTPNTAVDYTPTIGGGGGSAFELACNAEEILVGVHGNYSTYVNQIGPQCVMMDQLGRWIGDPVDRPVTGTTTSGTDFAKTCPRDFAVSGFQGRSGQYVNQLNIECKALTPTGGLTGAGQFLGADGGSGGSAQGTHNCGTNNPVYALYGRSGGWLDSFGVQCRQGVVTPISINSEPVIVNPGDQSDVVGLAVDLPINASDGDADVLTFSAVGFPPGLQIDTATGRVTGTPTLAGNFTIQVSVTDGTDTDTASFDWDIAASLPLSVEPMPPQVPQLVNAVVNYTAIANDGVNVVYKWNFGDGTPESSYASSSTIAHAFAAPGIYYVTLTVNDAFGVPQIQTFVQMIHLPTTAGPPSSSGKVAYEQRAVGNSRLWVVNQDNDTVSVFDVANNTKLAEVRVGVAPRSVAIALDGRVWVTNKSSASISIIDPVTLAVDQTVALPFASQPYGIVFSSASNHAFVVLEASGRVVKLDALDGTETGSVAVGPNPRHVSLDGAGATVYVSRFVTPRQPGEETATPLSEVGGIKYGGEVLVVNAATMSVTDTIVLQHSDKADAENQGSGVPNYLGPVSISPDGTAAWVPSKQDNIKRGTLRSGDNLNFQNTVRAISSRIDLLTGSEDYPNRIDHDNASMASAAVFDPLGIYLFVALETSREVAVVDAYAKAELFRIDTGRAPQGLTISPDGKKLYVSNFMDRDLSVFDLSELQSGGLWNVALLATLQSVASETLSPDVLLGKQLFYDARDTRLARDRYLSCASCHNDGAGDGRVWDLTGMGEGLRNSIKLRGTSADDGRLHWTQNFDEVQDFEGQIRSLAGGTGLMSDTDFNAGTRNQPFGDMKAGISPDLDALAAYVSSLDEFAISPHRNVDGSLTAAATVGRDVFRREDCAGCHSGVEFTDSDTDVLHDIGTIKTSSGSRLGGPLSGIDTPTLRGVWDSAPYLHDGSAASLADAVAAHDSVSLNAGEMSTLIAYLEQIDVNEVSAPLPNTPPTISSPGEQASETGVSVSLTITASDADGDDLSFSATGLPSGLTINSDSGLIGGAPGAAGNSTVTVTVSDAEDSASASFGWTVTVPNTPPTISSPGDQASETGQSVSLTISASDADGDDLSFSATGLPAGLTINSDSGLIGGAPGAAGNSTVTVTVSDAEDSASASFGWTVTVPNTPPAISSPGDQASETGQSVSLTISASDADGDDLSFSATGLPAGLTINSDSGLISGTPGAAGNSTVTVTVSDAEDSASASFGWTVTVPNTPPAISSPGDQASETGESVSLIITASDADGDDLSYSATGLPAGLTINSDSGLISGTPGAAGNSTVTVTVSDGEDSASASFGWTVTVPNTPPTISSPGNQASETGESVSLAITANDADGDDLSFSATGLPAGLTINSGSGLISGTPSAAGNSTVTVTVSDGEDSASMSFGWMTVASGPPPNTAPSLNNPGPQSHEVWQNVALTITASDADGDDLSYSATGLPAGLTINSDSGLINGAPSAAGSSTVMVTVSDGEDSAEVSFSWLVTVANSPPIISSPGNQASETGGSVSLTISASDADGDDLSYSATGLPAGLTINSTSGLISGTPTTAGDYGITVSVNDGEGSAEVGFEWSIVTAKLSSTNEGVGGGGGALDLSWLLGLSLFAVRVTRGRSMKGFRRPQSTPKYFNRHKSLAAGITVVLLMMFHQPTSFGSEMSVLPSYDRVRVLQSPPRISDVKLIDQDGRSFGFSQLRGQVSLIFFGFTNCPDVCPLALQKFRELEDFLGPDSDEIAFVMISVDGERDTPEVMKRFLGRYSPTFVGLTGERGDVKSLASEFSAAFFKGSAIDKSGAYTVSHSPQVFLVDQDGRLRAEFYNAAVEAMNGTVQALLTEARVEHD